MEKIILTGVGSAYITQPLYGLPTARVDEFLANGLGAQYMTKLNKLIVVSMGTGTSFVRVDGNNVRHIGGIGIGGGTILGLSRLMLKRKTSSRLSIWHNAARSLPSICKSRTSAIIRYRDYPWMPPLPFSEKLPPNAATEDIAAGIVHMVLQSIGQAAILSSLNSDVDDFILIGNLTRMPQCAETFPALEKMYGKRFHIPKYAEYRTAIGAALSYIQNHSCEDI